MKSCQNDCLEFAEMGFGLYLELVKYDYKYTASQRTKIASIFMG